MIRFIIVFYNWGRLVFRQLAKCESNVHTEGSSHYIQKYSESLLLTNLNNNFIVTFKDHQFYRPINMMLEAWSNLYFFDIHRTQLEPRLFALLNWRSPTVIRSPIECIIRPAWSSQRNSNSIMPSSITVKPIHVHTRSILTDPNGRLDGLWLPLL